MPRVIRQFSIHTLSYFLHPTSWHRLVLPRPSHRARIRGAHQILIFIVLLGILMSELIRVPIIFYDGVKYRHILSLLSRAIYEIDSPNFLISFEIYRMVNHTHHLLHLAHVNFLILRFVKKSLHLLSFCLEFFKIFWEIIGKFKWLYLVLSCHLLVFEYLPSAVSELLDFRMNLVS